MSKRIITIVWFVASVFLALDVVMIGIFYSQLSDLSASIHALRMDTSDLSAAMSADLNFKEGRGR